MSNFHNEGDPCLVPSNCPCKFFDMKMSFWTASQLNNISTVALVIAKQPHRINMLDTYGYSALHYAAQANNIAIVNMLLSHGAHPDGIGTNTSRCGATPLHRAAYAGSFESCSSLLNSGACANSIDTSFKDGRSALHKAAAAGHIQIIDLLLSHGADPNILDAEGKTYFDILDSNESCNKVQFDEKHDEEITPPVVSLNMMPQSSDESQVYHDDKTIVSSIVRKEESELKASMLCSRCNSADIAFRRKGDDFYCQKCCK